MIGVILWSNPPKEKAIIWCEDHGALAYLQGRANCLADDWPETGDLVELEYEEVEQHRMARQVMPVPSAGKSGLPGILRRMVQPPQPLRVVSNDEQGPVPQPCRVGARG